MTSRWHTSHEDDHAPIEMRFIDMFMAAVGSLVFIALLLVFLLPKTKNQSSASQNKQEATVTQAQFDSLAAQNKLLQAKIDSLQIDLQAARNAQSGSGQLASNGILDKEVIKRGFGVLIVASGCKWNDPELYVRFEGKLTDFLTGKPLDFEPIVFDASNTGAKTLLVGQKYFDIGWGAETPFTENSTLGRAAIPLETLSKKGAHLKMFQGVSSGTGKFSVYVSLASPQLQGDQECTIYPLYFSSAGLLRGRSVVLTQYRPFAWIRRMTVNRDGTLVFSNDQDEKIKAELAEFSAKQSKNLCERKSLCNTADANYEFVKPTKVSTVAVSGLDGTKSEKLPVDKADTPKSLWSQDGSLVYLVADGPRRSFYFETPKSTLSERGAKKGALLFDGKKDTNRYVGTAFAFEKGCAPKPYAVTGDISGDEKQITLRGRAPLLNPSCKVYGSYDESLVLNFQQQ